MATVKHTVSSNEYQEISSATGSIFIESGSIKITNQASQPATDAPVMDKLDSNDSKVIKVKSGEKLWARLATGKSASITYTEV